MTYVSLVLWPLVCLGVGALAGALQADALQTWYPTLVKPALTPPDWVFPVVWSIQYVLMGISVGCARMAARSGGGVIPAIFLAQLSLNFLWSIAFFVLHSPVAGLVVITALLALLVLYAYMVNTVSRPAALLFVPYIAWVSFAMYLNIELVRLN